MTAWIPPPQPPLVHARTLPLLVATTQLSALQRYADRSGLQLVEADVAHVTDTVGLIGAIRAELEFPEWCGSGWDSIHDALDELRAAWTFPLLLVLTGYDRLLSGHPHLALEAAVRLHELSETFGRFREQFMVVYEGEAWA